MMTDLLTEYAKTFGYTFRLQDYDVSSISALTQKLCHVVKVSRFLFSWAKTWRQHVARDVYRCLAFPCSPLALVNASQDVLCRPLIRYWGVGEDSNLAGKSFGLALACFLEALPK